MKKYIYLFIGLSLLCVVGYKLLSSDNYHPKALESKIRLPISEDPSRLDPRLVRSVIDVSIVKMLFEGLMQMSPEGKVIPGLAQKITVSGNRKEYTFYLKKSLWSNGDPVIAQDFVYAWQKSISPEFPSPYAYQLFLIRNGREIKNGDLLPDALGVKAIDNYTLKVNLVEPAPYFLDLLTMPIFSPINQKVEKDHSNAYQTFDDKHYICNGAFIPYFRRINEKLVLKKNPYYYRAKDIKYDKVEYYTLSHNTALELFEKGELDWIGSPLCSLPIEAIPTLKEQGKLKIRTASATFLLRFNTKKVPCDDKRVRQALSYAINREDIVNYVLQQGQLPALSITPVSLDVPSIKYFKDADSFLSRKLFHDYIKDSNFQKDIRPEITLTYPGMANADNSAHKVAQSIQQQWLEIFNIRVNLRALEGKVFFDAIANHDFQVAIGSWFADISDPVDFLRIFKHKEDSTNNTQWEHPEYINLLNSSDREKNSKSRLELLQFAEALLMEEMPIAPIYFYTFAFMENKQLKNVHVSDLGFVDLRYAFFQKE